MNTRESHESSKARDDAEDRYYAEHPEAREVAEKEMAKLRKETREYLRSPF